jgi:nucleotide-binding universal stress UspA family protein
VENEFKKIGLAIAISPTAQAMLSEATRLALLFNSELVLIHVASRLKENENKLNELIHQAKISVPYSVIWRTGNVEQEVLLACDEENIDLLVAGALKKENKVKHFIGSIARTIMRKANCSVYMVNNPSIHLQSIRQVVINAEDSPHIERAIAIGCQLAELENASWVHVVRELKMLSLTLSANRHLSEPEYNERKQKLVREEIQAVEKIMEGIVHKKTKVNIKVLSGKSGFELCKFVEKKKADLLVVGAPPQRLSLLDRIFPHDLEYVFGDLPCNLLVVNQPKENG